VDGKLDLDGEGGCKFLRVTLSLIMHNYPQLVYGALELLFRHFSQRQEVLQAFKQARISYWSLSVCLSVCLSPESLLTLGYFDCLFHCSMSSCFYIRWSDGCGRCFQSLLSVAVNVVTMLRKNSCLAQVYEAALCIDTDATGEAVVFNDTDAECTQVQLVCLTTLMRTVHRCSRCV